MNEVKKFKNDMNKLPVWRVTKIMNNMIEYEADPEFIAACKKVINQRRNLNIYNTEDLK